VPRRLLIANVVLLAACALFVTLMVRTARTRWPAPQPARARPPAAAPAPRPAPGPPAGGPLAYSVIPARNLFSPTRTEAPPPPATPTVSAPKPNLYGVVVREGASIAYLEDPATKRVAGYREGDPIAGGTIKTISNDRVVLVRPDGNIDVRLHDPTRPRPPAPPAAGAPGAPRPPGASAATPAAPGAPTPGAPAPPAPPGAVEGGATGRRALPPSLLRRLPGGAATSNAPQQ
jgi:hypothetical protein